MSKYRSWREQDGVIYFTLVSDGTTGNDWITRLKGRRMRLSDNAKSILRSPDFKPTSGVIYEIAVLKGMLFSDSGRVNKKICGVAQARGFSTPNAEIACLIREKFTDKVIEAMGLTWIITMHNLIDDSDGYPSFLYADRGDAGSWFDTYRYSTDSWWDRECGFAFVVKVK